MTGIFKISDWMNSDIILLETMSIWM